MVLVLLKMSQKLKNWCGFGVFIKASFYTNTSKATHGECMFEWINTHWRCVEAMEWKWFIVLSLERRAVLWLLNSSHIIGLTSVLNRGQYVCDLIKLVQMFEIMSHAAYMVLDITDKYFGPKTLTHAHDRSFSSRRSKTGMLDSFGAICSAFCLP